MRKGKDPVPDPGDMRILRIQIPKTAAVTQIKVIRTWGGWGGGGGVKSANSGEKTFLGTVLPVVV
jgi:hypothetical protein